MGFALADAALAAGAAVTLIHGPVAIVPPHFESSCKLISVETTAQMCEAVISNIHHADMLVMAAAPGDYSALKYETVKIKKSKRVFSIKLKRNPDILREVADICDSTGHCCVRVGFAAETSDIHRYAQKKLKTKRIDMICLNDIGQTDAGFALDTNRIIVYTRDGRRIDLPLMSKHAAAREVLEIASGFFV